MPKVITETPIDVHETPSTKLGSISEQAGIVFSAPDPFLNPRRLDEHTSHLNVCAYGPEGTGKTTALLSLINSGSVLLVSTQGGAKWEPLADMHYKVENINPWPEPGTEDVMISYEGLWHLGQQCKMQLLKNPGNPFGIVWDLGSEIFDAILWDDVEEAYRINQETPVHRRDKTMRPEGKTVGELRLDPFYVDAKDYGSATIKFMRLVKFFCTLPCHFGITALQRQDVDPERGFVTGPAMGPKAGRELLGATDINVAMNTEELRIGADPFTDVRTVYTGRFHNRGKDRAKNRMRFLPTELADPSFLRMIQYISNGLTIATDPIQQEWMETVRLAQKWKEESDAAEEMEIAERKAVRDAEKEAKRLAAEQIETSTPFS